MPPPDQDELFPIGVVSPIIKQFTSKGLEVLQKSITDKAADEKRASNRSGETKEVQTDI